MWASRTFSDKCIVCDGRGADRDALLVAAIESSDAYKRRTIQKTILARDPSIATQSCVGDALCIRDRAVLAKP